MPQLRVLAPGLQTTVQDLGRPGFAHLGVSASGAADAAAFRFGNLLAGNPQNAPALEMTLTGGSFEFDGNAFVALAGADFAATLDGSPVPAWTSIAVRAGQVLRCGATTAGARSYLCVRGGLDVAPVLGSASTHVTSGLGGWAGRPLQAGDVLSLHPPSGIAPRPLRLRAAVASRLSLRDVVRVTPGAHAELFAPDIQALFTHTEYRVTEAANRMGLRLAGAPLQRTSSDDLLTEGVPLGAIQVPPDGQPILSFVEHQTTGGYPKIANVIAADLHVVGQLRPRDAVRFEWVSLERAVELWAEHSQLFSLDSLEPA